MAFSTSRLLQVTNMVQRLLCKNILSTRSCISVFHRCITTDGQFSSSKYTHFGFESLPEDDKEEKVREVFENVAETYDKMNDAMSCGVHRIWKDYFMERMAPPSGTKLLDVAGGTGDIAFRFLDYVSSPSTKVEKYNLSANLGVGLQDDTDVEGQDNEENASESHVTVCDINQAMLDVGKKRAERRGTRNDISWIQGNAECLPIEDNSFDVFSIAFGIRNCTHVEKVIEEAHRVLKPGGRFMCLEFSKVDNAVLQWMYDQYSFQVIPVLGQVIARDWKSYQYLVESIRQFPDQEEFAAMIRSAGFRLTSFESLTFGVCAIHSAFKL